MSNETTPPHPETIKALIRIKFGSVRTFERKKELPPYSVRDVLRGRSVRATAIAISKVVGKSLDELFPGRFDPPSCAKQHNTSQKRDAHRQIARAR